MELDEPNPSRRRASQVVGIGASAGGLQAVLDLLHALPATLGIAYIVVHHLDPHAASALPELLVNVTLMPVQQAQHGMPVQADHVYVLAPQRTLTISQDVLQLLARADTAAEAHPIDTFLSSLAQDPSLFPFGVMLSGTGSDGARGLRAIQAQGGLTFAQQVASDTDSDLPHRALEVGCIDMIAPVEEIAHLLTRYSQGFPLRRFLDRDLPGQAASAEPGAHPNKERPRTQEAPETSHEELQAINDELSKANQALWSRNAHLRLARQLAEAIVETVREPLVVLDADLRVIQANQAFYQVFQTVRESTEQSLLEMLGDGQWDIPPLLTLLRDVLPANRTVEGFEVDHTFPAIGHKTFLLNARCIDGEGTGAQRILLAFEDDTARKLLEQHKDDFIRIASHELNTPMTSLKGYAELLWMLFRRAGDERAAQLLASMNRQIDHFMVLLREVLDVTQLETGHLPLHHQRCDLQALCRERIEEVQRTTPTHRIALEEQAACWIDADPNRIGQVVTNLLTNAIKYAPAAPLILVRLTTEPDAVTCSVQDSGPGIAPDQHTRLFKRFSRIGSASGEASQGLGLGLYLVAQIVERHGGRIWVESEEGHGATFRFTLPQSPVLTDNEERVEAV